MLAAGDTRTSLNPVQIVPECSEGYGPHRESDGVSFFGAAADRCEQPAAGAADSYLPACAAPSASEAVSSPYLSRSSRSARTIENVFAQLSFHFPEERDAVAALQQKVLVEEKIGIQGRPEDSAALSECFQIGIRLRDRVSAERGELKQLKAKLDDLNGFLTSLRLNNPNAMKHGIVTQDHLDAQRRHDAEVGGTRLAIAALEEKIRTEEGALSALATMMGDLAVGAGPFEDAGQEAVAEGTRGSIADVFGLTSQAHAHFEAARGAADRAENKLLALHYRFHAARTLPEEGEEQWEAKALELKAFAEASMRAASEAHDLGSLIEQRYALRDGFVLQMSEQTELQLEALKVQEEELRGLRADALLAEIDLQTRNGMERDDDAFERLHDHVMSQMNYATVHPGSPRESTSLMRALTSLHLHLVQEAAEDSRAGDLDTVRELTPKMEAEAATAQRMYRVAGGDGEALATLLDIAHFSIQQQCGLPIDAVYAWWGNAYKAHRDVPAIAQQADELRKKAPHLFDEQGELKPRHLITAAPEGELAGELEGKLHIATGTTVENVAIGGTASVGGAAIGAKAFAGAGVFCGPLAEWCVPIGGAIGGIGGFFAGDQIVKLLHADEVEEMESQARLGGMGLLRTTKSEAELTATLAYVGYGFGAVLCGVGGGFSAKATRWSLGEFAAAALTRQGWRSAYSYSRTYAVRTLGELVYESKHAGNFLRGAYQWGRGFLRDPVPPKGGGFVAPNLERSFELIYARMTPGQLASKSKEQWRAIFDDLVARGDTQLFRAPAAANKEVVPPGALDPLWRAMNAGADKGMGLAALDRAFAGRVAAANSSIVANVPELVESRLALMGRKELLRHAFRLESGWAPAVAGAAGAAGKAEHGMLWKVWNQHLWSAEFSKTYRFGLVPAAVDYAFVKDTPEGYQLTSWDGKMDTAWGIGGYIFGTGYYSTRLALNTYNGSIMGGGIKALTFVGFQGLAGLALADTDIGSIKGSQEEYLLVLPATLLLYSGMHAKGGSLVRGLSQVPFARRIPSISAWTSCYLPKSAINAPNFFKAMPGQALPVNLKGMGVSLGYTVPFIMGITAVTGKQLLDSDPYFIGQRGWKFFFVGTFLNPTQVALGGNTAAAQGGTRLLGILFDLIPAVSLSPYYNNRTILRSTLARMSRENGPGDRDEEMNLFFSQPENWAGGSGLSTVNRTYDIVGALKRDEFDVTKPSTWHAGWRWEPDGLDAWLDAMEGYKDKRSHKQVKGVGEEHPELYAQMADSFYRLFQDPSPWMGNEHRTRGMVIASVMTKWYAGRYARGEKEFEPYARLIERAPEAWRKGYWDKLPEPKSRKAFLQEVSRIQEQPLPEIVGLLGNSYQVEPPR